MQVIYLLVFISALSWPALYLFFCYIPMSFGLCIRYFFCVVWNLNRNFEMAIAVELEMYGFARNVM